MTARQIYRRAALAFIVFALVFYAGENFSGEISKSPLATNILLVVAAVSGLALAFYLPRSIRLWLRKKKK
ncbi:MAG: hypothetical protein B7Y89_07040 [Novosphingobium sp. 32-60-15]|nr:MAG: hypothetical protein B7Y89_07040 [Novosphingobium sp. 32-60-15]